MRLNAAEKLVTELLRLPPGESRRKVLEEPRQLHHHHPLMPAALAGAAREWTRCGDEAMAEEHYAHLGAMLSPGAIGTCECDRATFCQGLAQLRWRQGRLDALRIDLLDQGSLAEAVGVTVDLIGGLRNPGVASPKRRYSGCYSW